MFIYQELPIMMQTIVLHMLHVELFVKSSRRTCMNVLRWHEYEALLCTKLHIIIYLQRHWILVALLAQL